MRALEVLRRDIADARILEDEASLRVGRGEVLVRVHQLALTTNTLGYAQHGGSLGYWKLFSAPGERGRVPAWGTGTVVESTIPDLSEGSELYGFFPVASHAVVRPGRVTARSVMAVDDGDHSFASAYRRYERCDTITTDVRRLDALLRPLFTTSFLLHEAQAASGRLDVDTVVVTSASSKTALAFAFIHRSVGSRCRLVGVTADTHAEFVRASECHDDVVTYDDDLAGAIGSVAVVDFTGSDRVRADLLDRLGPRVTSICVAGRTHAGAATVEDAVGSADADTFYAPDHSRSRSDLALLRRHRAFTATWSAFRCRAEQLFQLEDVVGDAAILGSWSDLVCGRAAPAVGTFVHL